MRVKSSTKMKIWIVAALLIACAGLILLGNVSKGFQNMNPSDWNIVEVNEDNLYQAFAFVDDEGYLAKGENGLTVKLDDENVIEVDGAAEIDQTILVGTYTLKAGTSYVFDSGFKGSKGTIYLRLTDSTNGAEVKSCYNSAVVLSGNEIADDVIVNLEIVVAEGTDVNNLTIEPVLCVGSVTDDLVDFYK